MPIAVREMSSGYSSLPAGDSEAPALDVVETASGQDPAPRSARKPRPAWGWLYAVLPLTVLLFLTADMVPAPSGWHTLAEMIAALAVIGAIALWMHANRLALILAEYDVQSEATPELR